MKSSRDKQINKRGRGLRMIDTVNNRKLPENFADRVLTLEMELDRYGENIGVEKIKELLEIYCVKFLLLISLASDRIL